ncbi:sensor histidine kinase [Xanthomonas albilineans]|uniref:Putative two-component system sensor protein n=1 Tax=Xanthomonas albilineans (strain GPE PC73 / CFBP 7063) TaxID=380358 RepID=D2UA49_XANAP|nr:histidine kinase [Xanthomonas albilineans]PPU94915.1 sensor histidine kinase [Xanthomonas albilineans]QHQ28006.1 putative two-component system sensor protein [Xanthomonas albilineans]CBA15789.1 putative two-component system sensor protein [Xanthomonas albilineans GPE PC73]
MPASAYSNDQLQVLKQPSTLIWIVMAGECIAAILALTPFPGTSTTSNRWVYFGLASLGIQWIALLTLASLLLLRRILARRGFLAITTATLCLMQALTWLISGLVLSTFGDYWQLSTGSWLTLSLQLSGIALLIGLLGMAALHNHVRIKQLVERAKQAEIDALAARVQPHFLFNTLNTAVMLVHRQPQQVEQLLMDLSDLFRAALARPDLVDLQDEIDLAKRYLDIEAIRFGPRLRVHWTLPHAIAPIRIPRLSLQPLLENAVHHGIECAPEGGEICIGIDERSDALEINIRNPLPPSGAAPHLQRGHRVGLSALRTRLESLQGASLRTASDGDSFVATIRIALRS